MMMVTRKFGKKEIDKENVSSIFRRYSTTAFGHYDWLDRFVVFNCTILLLVRNRFGRVNPQKHCVNQFFFLSLFFPLEKEEISTY